MDSDQKIFTSLEVAEDYRHFARGVMTALGERMYGMEQVTRLSLMALYTNGHVLLEGNPGLGKTEFVKALGWLLKLEAGRIQFTPDLMPADITGTKLPDSGDRLVFNPGPVFTTLLLADEINRATPKTQSAMLEAMAERQVTVLGERWPLMPRSQALAAVAAREAGEPPRSGAESDWPFMVLATQNPIDQEGTYQLPEAQADRFMFKLMVPTPNAEILKKIMKKTAGNLLADTAAAADVYAPLRGAHAPTDDRELARTTHRQLVKLIKNVQALSLVEEHICNLVLATNGAWDELGAWLKKLPAAEAQRLSDLSGLAPFGLGPRAATSLMLGAKAYGLLFQTKDKPLGGIEGLVQVLIPVLRHRLKLDFDWAERYLKLIQRHREKHSAGLEGLKAVGVLNLLEQQLKRRTEAAQAAEPVLAGVDLLRPYLIDLCWLTAPVNAEYRARLREELRGVWEGKR